MLWSPRKRLLVVEVLFAILEQNALAADLATPKESSNMKTKHEVGSQLYICKNSISPKAHLDYIYKFICGNIDKKYIHY